MLLSTCRIAVDYGAGNCLIQGFGCWFSVYWYSRLRKRLLSRIVRFRFDNQGVQNWRGHHRNLNWRGLGFRFGRAFLIICGTGRKEFRVRNTPRTTTTTAAAPTAPPTFISAALVVSVNAPLVGRALGPAFPAFRGGRGYRGRGQTTLCNRRF